MTDGTDTIQQFDQLARRLMTEGDADIILYCGPIDGHPASHLIGTCRVRTARRKNAWLFIITDGGSADAAFQIARCLQRNYDTLTVYVSENCKSAGTLVAVGADEIVFSDFGELGPLDVQLSKPDELGEMSSGLTSMQALNTLAVQSFSLFERNFLRIRVSSEFQITTRTAAEIASNMAVGLFAPIYAQIDPMRLGEIDRAMRIAQEYGERIGTKNLKPGALENLVAAYPSHEFVIDIDEAKKLFKNVREATSEENTLTDLVHPILHMLERDGTIVDYLEDILDEWAKEDKDDEDDAEAGHERQVDGSDRKNHEDERPEGGETDREGDA